MAATILILTAVRPGLRGEITRWMIEPKTGVFVGRLSGRVRDRLWERVVDQLGKGDAIMVVSAQNEQGFEVRMAGTPDRFPVDYDGLTLVSRRLRGKSC